MKNRKSLLIILAAVLVHAQPAGQEFYPDDPVWTEPMIKAPCPVDMPRSQIADYLTSSYLQGPDDTEQIPAAINANTLGEVPDSSWFTNRIGKVAMTPEEAARGPNTGDGPDLSTPLLVTDLKPEGATPGFVAKDARGDTYFVKLDPQQFPQLATSSEVISTKFLYLAGYNVPENYLVWISPEDVTIDPESEDGEKLERILERIFKKAAWRPDGTVQILASRRIPGKPVGPFSYFGIRSDDPNDVVRHEHRRELRGLRVFAAWLNHPDSRSLNTLDVCVAEQTERENPRGVVKHYLIDFGYTLASATKRPKAKRMGHEYTFAWEPMLKSALSFGLWERPWRRIEFGEYPETGHFEADFFQPNEWRPEYPNPAFKRMLADDAFWATKIVARYSEEHIRAMVAEGHFDDPDASEYLVQTLLRRQHKIVNYYFSQLNPLDEFIVQQGNLNFKNLGVEHNVGLAESYNYRWFLFDNESGATVPLGSAGSNNEPSVPIPSEEKKFLMVRISTHSPDQQKWSLPVQVYLKNGTEIVGIDRTTEGP